MPVTTCQASQTTRFGAALDRYQKTLLVYIAQWICVVQQNQHRPAENSSECDHEPNTPHQKTMETVTVRFFMHLLPPFYFLQAAILDL
jgi:hypothetical protein